MQTLFKKLFAELCFVSDDCWIRQFVKPVHTYFLSWRIRMNLYNLSCMCCMLYLLMTVRFRGGPSLLFQCTFLYKSHEIHMKSSASSYVFSWDRFGSVCLVCFMEAMATQANKKQWTTVLFLIYKCGLKIIKLIIWDQVKKYI